jgi:hypothetical protein
VEHQDEPLAQYTVQFQPDKKQLRGVKESRLVEHRFGSPQPLLWPADAVE